MATTDNGWRGTWSWRGTQTAGEWYQAGAFVTWLEAHDVEVVSKARPFVWTSRVNGLWLQRHKHLDWEAGGANLAAYLDPALPHIGLGPGDSYDAVISHSHGLQVCLYACLHGARFPLLIDVAGPVRKDMKRTARAARASIHRWVHINSDWSDKMQAWGELCDGVLGAKRAAIWPTVWADVSIGSPKVGHGALLREPDQFFHWERDIALFEELDDVDDQHEVLEAIRFILKDKYSIATAGEVEEAFRYLEATSVKLVLLDIKMPKIDGMAALKHIKKKYPGTEVIMVLPLQHSKQFVRQ